MKVRLTKLKAMQAIEEAANLNYLKPGCFYRQDGCKVCAVGAIASQFIKKSPDGCLMGFEMRTNIGKCYMETSYPSHHKKDNPDSTDLAKISAAFEYADDMVDKELEQSYYGDNANQAQYRSEISSTHAMFEIMYLEGTHVNFENNQEV